jgi:hypothetical protein
MFIKRSFPKILNEATERNPILAKAKELRNKAIYADVYISPDLTEAERLQDYELRKQRDKMNDERKKEDPFRYAVRGNAVVKFKIKQ